MKFASLWVKYVKFMSFQPVAVSVHPSRHLEGGGVVILLKTAGTQPDTQSD